MLFNKNNGSDKTVQQDLANPAEPLAPADENQPGQDSPAPPLTDENGNLLSTGEAVLTNDDPNGKIIPVIDSNNPPEDKTVQQEPVELVKMVREGEPSTADVHPLEVENFKAGGWRLEE